MVRQRARFCSTIAVGVATGLLLLTACRDAVHPTAERTTRARLNISNSAALLDSAWISFALDAEVTLVRFDSLGRPLLRRNIPVRYHLARTLGADGRWATTMTFAPRVRGTVEPGTGRFEPERFEIGTIADAGDGTPLQVINGLGQPVSRPGVLGPARSTARPPEGPPPYDRSWVRSYILPASERDARNARLTRLGTPTHVPGGLDRYSVARGPATRVLLVDPAIGAAVDIADATDGHPIRHMRLTYAVDGDGNAVRTGMRLEQFGLGPAHQRVSTAVTYSNIHLSRGS
ncbi:MAG TPA: hypothetical protein VG916_08125 [Gemmatimonadaceae bacterium]|nr:hypothetical protein [Gemmatimonadaceae bacterium]